MVGGGEQREREAQRGGGDASLPPAATLAAALSACSLSLASEQVASVERYAVTLWKWNQRLNLTRHLDYATFVARDLMDCMQLAAQLPPQQEVLDVGSGGGVPGALLAILRPDLELTLTESVGKKADALRQIVDEAKIPATVYPGRAEQLLDDYRFHAGVARAVGPMWKICRWFEGRWDAIDRLLLIKGPAWTQERHEARERGLLRGLALRKVSEYVTPGTGARCVILQLAADRGGGS